MFRSSCTPLPPPPSRTAFHASGRHARASHCRCCRSTTPKEAMVVLHDRLRTGQTFAGSPANTEVLGVALRRLIRTRLLHKSHVPLLLGAVDAMATSCNKPVCLALMMKAVGSTAAPVNEDQDSDSSAPPLHAEKSPFSAASASVSLLPSSLLGCLLCSKRWRSPRSMLQLILRLC